jgi:hypothetical protein
MENYTLLESIQQEMKALGCDVKAETQLVLALEKGLMQEDFVVRSDSLFVREFSKDLVNPELKEDVRKRMLLELHLSRGGVYDQLPEGLFFQQFQQRGKGFAADMAADHKRNKKKEEDLRQFFLPFDNDFFWQRIQLEQEEGRLLEGLQSGILNDYFVEFWNIPRSIPRAFIAPLILLLPYAHQIAGNLQLTAECLEQLLLEPVLVNQKRPDATHTKSILSPGLGEGQLGLDMLCGEEFWEDCPVIEFVIGPLQRSRVTDYLDGGNRFEFLETFNRFFVPAGLDIEFAIRVPAENQNMIILQEDGPVLGYSSVL